MPTASSIAHRMSIPDWEDRTMHDKPRVDWRLVLAVWCVSWWVAASAGAYPEGPPDGVAGDPPAHFTCTLCHDLYPLSSGNGSLELLGLPVLYTSGAQYDLTVRLADPGQVEWGFEITAQDEMGHSAGTFMVTDPLRTQLSDNPGTSPDYLKHTRDGTYEGTADGPVSWTFRWTAPASGSVTFYLAGNAADGTGDPWYDYIYALERTVEQPTVGVASRTWSEVKELYRHR